MVYAAMRRRSLVYASQALLAEADGTHLANKKDDIESLVKVYHIMEHNPAGLRELLLAAGADADEIWNTWNKQEFAMPLLVHARAYDLPALRKYFLARAAAAAELEAVRRGSKRR